MVAALELIIQAITDLPMAIATAAAAAAAAGKGGGAGGGTGGGSGSGAGTGVDVTLPPKRPPWQRPSQVIDPKTEPEEHREAKLREIREAAAKKKKKAEEDDTLAEDRRANRGYLNTAARGLVRRATLGVVDADSSATAAKKAEGGGSGRGGGVMVGNLLISKLGEMLSPLAIFGQVLGSASSGFQMLGLAVKVLVSAFGPILFPVIIAIAGALVDLSDDLEAKLMPVMKDWMKFIFSTLIPVLQFLVDVIMTLVDAVMFVADKIKGVVGGIAEVVTDPVGAAKKAGNWALDKAGDLLDTINPFSASDDKPISGGLVSGLTAAVSAAASGVAPAGAAPAAGEAPKRKGIDDVLTSFRMSMGPKAQYTGLTQLGQQQQLAALNADPLEARILRATLRTADAAEAGLAESRAERRGGLPYGTS